MDGMDGTAVLETPAVETPQVQAQTEPAETGAESRNATTPDAPVDPKAQPDKVDRRTNPDALKKTLKWLRENGGEHSQQAQAIENMLGETKSYKTVYPTVKEARDAKAALDAVGGAAKVAELQQYTTRMREVDEMLESGDPKVLDVIFETGGKGLAKLLPNLIEKLSTTDAAAVQAALQPHAIGFLDAQGLPEAIDAMVSAFNAGKPDDAKGVLAKIVSWYKGMAQPGAEKPPEQAAWEKERETWQSERFNGEVKAAFDTMVSHAEQSIDRELAPELKKYGIPPETASLIREDVWKRIERERNADPLFKSTIAAKVNERTRKVDPSTADYLKSETDKRVKDAVRKEIELRYGFIRKQAPADPNVKPNPTAAPTGAVVAIDHNATIRALGSRSAAQDSILQGKAFNSAGKPIVKVGKLWKLA